MKKGEALKYLSACDHGFIAKRKVQEIGKAFGVTLSTYLAKANPNDFKGLSLWNEQGQQVSEMEGQAAHIVASELCRKLDIDYEVFNGIGSQLAECCHKLANYLHNAKATPARVA